MVKFTKMGRLGAQLRRPLFKKKEDGNIIDQLGAIIVMAFIFAMILAYAAYGKSVKMKLAIDNVSKEYLYAMEQEGYLNEANKASLEESLTALGVTVTDGFAGTSEEQVPYGDQVVLQYNCEFQNPLFTTFATDTALFRISGFDEMNTYNVFMSATAKW